MNVSTEVLFPDLCGFAGSLVQQLAYVDIYGVAFYCYPLPFVPASGIIFLQGTPWTKP